MDVTEKKITGVTHMSNFHSFKADSFGKQDYFAGSVYANGLAPIQNSHLTCMLIAALLTITKR